MIKNKLDDLRLNPLTLTGFFRGVVESRDDPEKAGRCQIRVWGIHTAIKERGEKEGIPTEDLPWAQPALGLIEGSISGFGMFAVPLQGSHVAVFFEDGNITRPIYFATLPGVPTEAPVTNEGFNDPDGIYPTSHRLDEPDIHRTMRGESAETIVTAKNENLDLGVTTALGGSWNEPESGYNAVYPENIVLATHGGILMEWDSTKDAKRWHIYHPSNSYIEFYDSGDMVIRNQKDKFEIVISNKNQHIGGNRNVTTGGNSKEKVGGGADTEIGLDNTEDIGGSRETTIGNNWTVTVSGEVNINVTGNANITASIINLN